MLSELRRCSAGTKTRRQRPLSESPRRAYPHFSPKCLDGRVHASGGGGAGGGAEYSTDPHCHQMEKTPEPRADRCSDMLATEMKERQRDHSSRVQMSE